MIMIFWNARKFMQTKAKSSFAICSWLEMVWLLISLTLSKFWSVPKIILCFTYLLRVASWILPEWIVLICIMHSIYFTKNWVIFISLHVF
jgi:hypothetical protein